MRFYEIGAAAAKPMAVGGARHFNPSPGWCVKRRCQLSACSAGTFTLAAPNIQLEATFAGHQIIKKRLPLMHMRIGVCPRPTATRTQIIKRIGLPLEWSPHLHLVKSHEPNQYMVPCKAKQSLTGVVSRARRDRYGSGTSEIRFGFWT